MTAAAPPALPPPVLMRLRPGEEESLFWQIRELIRFGLERFVIAAAESGGGGNGAWGARLAERLPRPVRLWVGPPGWLAEREAEWAGDTPLLLEQEGVGVTAVNFARFLYEPGPLPRRLILAGEGGDAPGGFILRPRLPPALPAPPAVMALPGRCWENGAAAAAWLRRRPALFLDRDGVINRDLGYVGTLSRFQWTEGARRALREAAERGVQVFVVTNQSGIGRGFYSEDDLGRLHAWMTAEIRAAGGTIDDWRFCPHHPEATVAAYRRVCTCRKPAPGMITDLLAGWGIDPAAALLVGDRESDLEAARRAGIRGLRFTGGDLAAFLLPHLERLGTAAADGGGPDDGAPHAPSAGGRQDFHAPPG